MTAESTPPSRTGDLRAFAIGLPVVGLLIAFLILLTLSNIHTLLGVGGLVEHSADVIDESQSLFSAIQDAETGQRGYLLTGRTEYLLPYRAGVAAVGRHLAQLGQVLENPADRARLARIQSLAALKLRELQETIDLQDHVGADAALRMVQTNVGNQTMEEIRGLCRSLISDTRRRLDDHATHFGQASQVAQRDLEIGGLMLLLFLGLFAILIHNQLEARRRNEARILESHQGLVRALNIRNTFLSVAGHELRTPIGALGLTLQNLRRRLKRGQQIQESELETPLRQVDRLTRLTETLLDVQRIETGRLTMEREEMDLAALVRDVVERMRPQAEESKTTLDVAAEGPIVGRWDKLRLEQVLMNLITNSIKFGGGSPVRIHAEAADSMAIVEVSDEGVGIAPEDQERIFKLFERAGSERSFRGMGLGLWIAREIVRAHNGTISVQSKLGHGATLRVALPYKEKASE